MDNITTKTCTRCKKIKAVELFDKKAANKTDGRKSWCKECSSKHSAKVWSAYKKDKDNASLSASPYKFLKHWLCDIRKTGIMHNRRRHPVDPHLDMEDLLELWEKQKGKCALTNINMTHIKGAGRVDTNISIDRIDGDIKKYTRDNIQLVCYRVNMMKHKMGEKDLNWWCNAVIEASK
tara:strand:+ start:585 stop:1118 length:534 start_codon:yes stop_codon:yes gene_type:complete